MKKNIKIDPDKIIKIDPVLINESFSHPDPKKHQLVSFIKSAVRIVGYFLIPFSLPLGAAVLILSEGIGIVEELV
jgi:hypothetical protein